MIEIANDRTPIEEMLDYRMELAGHIGHTKMRLAQLEAMLSAKRDEYNQALQESEFDFTGMNVPFCGESSVYE